MKKFVIAGVLVLCAATNSTCVRADLKYTTKTTMAQGSRDNATMPASSFTRYVRAGAERSETSMTMGNFKMNSITIHICDPTQEIQLAPDLKIYAVLPSQNSAAAGGASTQGATAKDEKTTGKMVITYGVKDLGTETVADWKTHHYLVTSHMENSGCIGNSTTDSKIEYWIADVKDAYPCRDAASMASMPQMAGEKCRLEYVTKGDVAAYQKIFSGLIVRQKIYNGDAVLMTLDVTSLSQAKLDDALFEVPKDYKKVTPEEFQKQQSAAMVKAMMAGQTPAGDDDKNN